MRNIIKNILNEEVDSRSERVKSMVKKFGIDRSIEMIVGGMDTIINAYQDNPESFLDQFNDLKPKEIFNKIYYVDKDGNALFYYYPNGNTGIVYFHYFRIWKFFDDVIGLKYPETEYIINNWLKDTYNLKGLTPSQLNSTYKTSWE